jgi:hypothetical protein
LVIFKLVIAKIWKGAKLGECSASC